eukprot:m51a1_g10693 hypothetical protein (284) ;mRNA; r:137685-138637
MLALLRWTLGAVVAVRLLAVAGVAHWAVLEGHPLLRWPSRALDALLIAALLSVLALLLLRWLPGAAPGTDFLTSAAFVGLALYVLAVRTVVGRAVAGSCVSAPVLAALQFLALLGISIDAWRLEVAADELRIVEARELAALAESERGLDAARAAAEAARASPLVTEYSRARAKLAETSAELQRLRAAEWTAWTRSGQAAARREQREGLLGEVSEARDGKRRVLEGIEGRIDGAHQRTAELQSQVDERTAQHAHQRPQRDDETHAEPQQSTVGLDGQVYGLLAP